MAVVRFNLVEEPGSTQKKSTNPGLYINLFFTCPIGQPERGLRSICPTSVFTGTGQSDKR